MVPHKAAILLGDLRAKKAVPALTARLHMKARGDEQRSALIALGYIADAPAVDAILSFLRDPKADPAARASAADALYLSGDRRAVPTLFEIAKSGYVVTGGQKASDLRASAAIALSRIAGKESFEAFKALADKETEAQGVFGMALDRMLVANECDRDVQCYGKKLLDPSWTRAEKAAFAIGFSGNAKDGLPLLLAAMKPIAAMNAERFPVHQAILFSLSRLGTKDCAACVDKLEKQIERDEKAVRIPGARDLLGETRVTDGDHPEPRHQGHHGAEHARPRRRGGGADADRQGQRQGREDGEGGQAREEAATSASERARRSPLAEAGRRSPRNARRRRSLLLVLGDDRRVDAAAHLELALDARAPRRDCGHQVVEDPVGDRLVECALVAVRPEIELPRLELDAELVGDVLDADGGEVGLAGLGTEAGELGALELDHDSRAPAWDWGMSPACGSAR